ncbi:MAG: tetratricopeptide repeat protein [Opitutae bacterium]
MKTPRAQRRHFIWAGLLLTGVIGAGWLGWIAIQRHNIVAEHLPDRPELGSYPSDLIDLIAQAEGTARGYVRPAAGLAALSRFYHANGFYPAALLCYDGLRLLEPQGARWAHLPACILAEFGRLDEALPLERRAIELAPDYLPARLRLGDILLKNNQITEASAAYAAVLEREPGNPYALLGLARGAISHGAWTKAAEHLRLAVSRHPDFIGALSLLVTVDEHLGALAEVAALKAAIGKREFSDLTDEWLASLVEDCYDSYRLSVAAAVAKAAGDTTATHRHLERAIAIAPANSGYRRQLAALLTREGKLPEARVHLEKAVAAAPEDADSWLFLVQNLNALGETVQAEQMLTKGLSVCPLSPSLHLERARWWSKAGRPEEAILEYRESYRLRPSEASPLVELATVYFSVGRVDEAVAALREALLRQPAHPIAQATLALIAISQGDEAGARGWWNRVRLQPDTPPPAVETIRQAFQQQFGRSLP